MKEQARIGFPCVFIVGAGLAACAVAQPSDDVERASAASQALSGKSVELRSNAIVVDGRPVLLRGGTLQWFRLPRDTWDDRMRRFKAAGYNTIDMYVAWRNHEPEEGKFDFTTFDIRAFLDLAKQHGLYVYFRPGPYITNEMDAGGVPAWVLTKTSKKTRDADVADGTLNLRTNDRDYLDAVTRYFAALNDVVRPYLHTNGGPIVLYSVENEYNWFETAFGLDKLTSYEGGRERPEAQTPDVRGYFERLRDIVRSQGVDVPITTCPGDGTTSGMDGVAGVVPMPNVYSSLGTIEHTAAQLLRDMHDPARNRGSYVGYPSGITETDRAPSVLRRFVLGGMDAVFQFNAVGMAQEGYQNAVVLHGGAINGVGGALDFVKNVTDVRFGYAGTAFFRPPVGYFQGVVDYYGAIGPSGTLREKFYAIRRTNLFLSAFEAQIAAAGEPRRSSAGQRFDGDDRRVFVTTDAAGVKDPEVRPKVSYWLDLGDDSALLGLYTDGAKPITLPPRSIQAFGDAFPRFTSVTVPVEDEPSVRAGASLQREYLKFVPIRFPITSVSTLRYTTSEILTARSFGGGKLVVLYGAEGSDGETRITGTGLGLTLSQTSGGVVVHENTSASITVSYAHRAGAAETFTVIDGAGTTTRYVVLERAAAGRAWFVGEAEREAMLVGPAYVDESGAGVTLELSGDDEDVLALSPAPIALDGLATLRPFDAATGMTAFRATRAAAGDAPRVAVSLGIGRAKRDVEETKTALAIANDAPWTALGSEPDFLERHGIASGHAWYRGDVNLTAAEARDPGSLYIDGVSDFGGIYVNGVYLLTVAPLGTEVNSASHDSEYGFRIPAGVLHAGRNVIAIRNEIWGHGSFMFPRGVFDRVSLPLFGMVPLPFARPKLPALGFDALKGVAGAARLGKKAIGHWQLRAKLGGELAGFDRPEYDDTSWTRDGFPRALGAGEVVWYRTHFASSDLPDPSTWAAPVVLSLGGTSAKATVYLNGRLIARWLSGGSWLRRGSWVQAERDMWISTPPDDFPVPRESLRSGDNVLSIAFEDASDATANGAPGVVDRLELRLARENKEDTGTETVARSAVNRRVATTVRPVASR